MIDDDRLYNDGRSDTIRGGTPSIRQHPLTNVGDVMNFIRNQLHGDLSGLSTTEIRELLTRVNKWREGHAQTDFIQSQLSYHNLLLGAPTTNVTQENQRSTPLQSFVKNANVTKLHGLLDKARKVQPPTRQSTKSKEEEEEIDSSIQVDDILTITANTMEAEILNEMPKKSKPKAKKRPKVTIPEPFQFDKRERTKKKTIHQKRFEEYVDSIKEEEDQMIKNHFKAKPVPSSTLEPRYQELCLQRQTRSEEIKQMSKQWLIKTQRPFEFMKTPVYDEKKKRHLDDIRSEVEFVRRPFKANPLPKSTGQSLSERIKKEDELRRHRVASRAQWLKESSSLPPRMQMWETNQTLNQERAQSADRAKSSVRSDTLGSVNRASSARRRSTNHLTNPEFTFQPHVNTNVPNFSKLQKAFADELKKRKESKPKVFPEPFSFDTRDYPDRMKKILQDIENDEQKLPETRWPYKGTRERIPSTPPPNEKAHFTSPATTRATTLRESVVRQTLAQREQERLRQEEEMREYFSKRRRLSDVREDGSHVEKNSPQIKHNTRRLSDVRGDGSQIGKSSPQIKTSPQIKYNPESKGAMVINRGNLRQSKENPRRVQPKLDKARQEVLYEVEKVLKKTGNDHLVQQIRQNV